jgi:hypothetical protein
LDSEKVNEIDIRDGEREIDGGKKRQCMRQPQTQYTVLTGCAKRDDELRQPAR